MLNETNALMIKITTAQGNFGATTTLLAAASSVGKDLIGGLTAARWTGIMNLITVNGTTLGAIPVAKQIGATEITGAKCPPAVAMGAAPMEIASVVVTMSAATATGRSTGIGPEKNGAGGTALVMKFPRGLETRKRNVAA
jgi:hypothetical protein